MIADNSAEIKIVLNSNPFGNANLTSEDRRQKTRQIAGESRQKLRILTA